MISINKSDSLRQYIDTEIEYIDPCIYIDIENIDRRNKVILSYCQNNFLKYSVKLYVIYLK